MATKIVKNKSKGYNYNYASLSDLAEQDITVPKMRIKVIDGIEYTEYYDEVLKDWELGARVVIPNNKGMSEAQNYGSGLAYARRYTTLMSQAVATTDDKAVEEKEQGANKEPLATSQQVEIITKNKDWLLDELKELKVDSPSKAKQLTQKQASKLCQLVKERRKQ